MRRVLGGGGGGPAETAENTHGSEVEAKVREDGVRPLVPCEGSLSDRGPLPHPHRASRCIVVEVETGVATLEGESV